MKPLCVVSCPIDTFSGYGARARDFVKSLIQSKGEEWDIKIMPQRWGDCPWNFLSKDNPLRKRFIPPKLQQQPDIWFQITIPNEFQPVGKYNVGITAGLETTACPPEWIEGLNRMNLNIVPAKFIKETLNRMVFDKHNDQKQKVGLGLEKVCTQHLPL